MRDNFKEREETFPCHFSFEVLLTHFDRFEFGHTSSI